MTHNKKNVFLRKSLTRDDWQPLFGLIPEIEKAEDFGTIEGGEEIEPGVFEFPLTKPGWTILTLSPAAN